MACTSHHLTPPPHPISPTITAHATTRNHHKHSHLLKPRNHPKKADFYMTFLLVNFAVKNAMFNLNENNRFVMAQHPSDMRIGV
ncbi:MAG: hypothetical protein MR446_07785, partial [Bacteroidales bacterium]|nr:hypothetical protein [Bacteroidales bacterium]